MKQVDTNAILEQFEASGRILYDTALNGDYKVGNKEAKKLINLFKLFEKDPVLADECIPLLLKSENVVLRIKGAAYCLALKRNVDIGEKVLKEISEDRQYGIHRFDAEMTLKQWYKQGFLLVYQK